MKECGHCKQIKVLSSFAKNKSTGDGLTSYCKECRIIYNKQHSKYIRKRYNSDPKFAEKQRMATKKWKEGNPDRSKESGYFSDIKRKYNLERKEYEEMLALQKGLCKICGKTECRRRNGKISRLHVDHDHETGKIRGLLCAKCNTSIGKLNSVELLQAAIDYLIRSG